MTDGATSLMTMFYGMKASNFWTTARGANMLDGGAHFYDVYETADGKFVSLGSIEPQFYALLRDKAGLEDAAFDAQMDRGAWPKLKEKVAAVIKTKTRDEWDALMEGTDVCYAPVLDMDEAAAHPHNLARETLVERNGVTQPNVAPRFQPHQSEIQATAGDWRIMRPPASLGL